MTETKNCIFCGKEFEGTKAAKYCCEVHKELAGVERRTGYRAEDKTCSGNCNKVAKKRLRRRPRGWLYLDGGKREFGVYVGEIIEYCPWCGGRLE